MEKDEKSIQREKYAEIAKNSLIKVQYSCGGNSTSIEEPESIPIVPESYIPESKIIIVTAREEDVEDLVALLKTSNLPVSDLGLGQRIFLVALSDEKVVGCVALEIYEDAGLLRSLAVNNDSRGKGIGQKLVAKAEAWSQNHGLKNLYLLTTTAAGFFTKLGWHRTDRTSVPNAVALSSEFTSICPSTAICMFKNIN
ncbi:MAG: arsenic resistance N-acetyltransferase ArsN2 [Paludibacter sp.]